HKNEEIDLSIYKLIETNYINNGRTYRMFEMNRAFFTLLVMGFNGSKALVFKTDYIKQFDFMEHELIARGETRHIGISVRKDLTKAIIDYVPDNGNFKKFAISNYTGLVYKKVLKMTLKKYKELHNIPKGQKNRDFLNKEQLEQVQYYESKIADIIEVSSDLIDEKELYQNIKKFVNK
ncbi:MAG: Rha family transcriptional regulator, partial [Cyclobacteriaceae bacterium]